jgi:hypothetical protein
MVALLHAQLTLDAVLTGPNSSRLQRSIMDHTLSLVVFVDLLDMQRHVAMHRRHQQLSSAAAVVDGRAHAATVHQQH